jgi:hypothetical protein
VGGFDSHTFPPAASVAGAPRLTGISHAQQLIERSAPIYKTPL